MGLHRGEGGARGASGGAGIAQLVAKPGGRRTLIDAGKRQAVEGMPGVFANGAESAAADREAGLERLHARIGQLVVGRDFLRQGERARATAPSGPASVDEPRPEARDDRAGASAAADRPAVPARLDQPVGL